jgi:hypothetical protein
MDCISNKTKNSEIKDSIERSIQIDPLEMYKRQQV